jgi:thioesterase domain-containing protein
LAGSYAVQSRISERGDTKRLVAVQPGGTKPPLFCVHGHNNNVFFIRKLSRLLGADQPILSFIAKGLTGEEPHHTIEDMAADYVREIRTILPEGPYYISGFCFGGMVAYEMARLLEMEGKQVALLVLFNAPSPGSLKRWPYSCLMKRFTHELRKIRALQGKKKLAVLVRKASGVSKQIMGNFTRALSRALPQSSNSVAGEGARRWLSLGNLNILAAQAYNPTPYAGRIILFVTEEVGSRYEIDPARGWGEFAADGIEVYPVAGDNLSLFDEGIAEALGEKLRFCLARAHCKDEHVSAPAPKLPSEELELPIGKI